MPRPVVTHGLRWVTVMLQRVTAAVILMGVILMGGATGCATATAGIAPNSIPRPDRAPGPTPQQAASASVSPSVAPTVATSGIRVSKHGPTDAKRMALTFDDGFCSACIATVVATLEETGAHATFCPNGQYDKAWAPHADRIKALIAKGQVVMCNHTVRHKQSTKLSDWQLSEELRKNDEWIRATFGVSSKPWFRPPYGDRNARTDAAAAAAGYNQVVMWDGTVADWTDPSPEQLMKSYRAGLHPGGVLLAHLNQMVTATHVEAMINEATAHGYTLCTLPEMLGTPPVPAAPVGPTTAPPAQPHGASTTTGQVPVPPAPAENAPPPPSPPSPAPPAGPVGGGGTAKPAGR